MKALKKIFKSISCVVFLDLEGTQFSHEIIEIGAIKSYIDEECQIKRNFKEFHCYVKSKAKIGELVTNLTNIDQHLLDVEGIEFSRAIAVFKKYLGKDFNKCLFLTYGNSDAAMFHYTLLKNEQMDGQDVKWIAKRCFDFSSFLKNYITDQNGNCLSLKHALEVFNLKFEGKEHGALCDAKNLQILYKNFLIQKDIVKNEYKKTLFRKSNLPGPIQKVMNKLKNGETITPEDYDQIIEDNLR